MGAFRSSWSPRPGRAQSCLNNRLSAVGLVLLGTAAIGWCPAYLPFGIEPCKTDG